MNQHNVISKEKFLSRLIDELPITISRKEKTSLKKLKEKRYELNNELFEDYSNITMTNRIVGMFKNDNSNKEFLNGEINVFFKKEKLLNILRNSYLTCQIRSGYIRYDLNKEKMFNFTESPALIVENMEMYNGSIIIEDDLFGFEIDKEQHKWIREIPDKQFISDQPHMILPVFISKPFYLQSSSFPFTTGVKVTSITKTNDIVYVHTMDKIIPSYMISKNGIDLMVKFL